MEDLQAANAIKHLTTLQHSNMIRTRSASQSSTTCSNVPSLLSNTFVSRESDLEWIASVLALNSTNPGSRRAAIFGMTGVSKSQLMLKYEELHRSKYTHRFWVTSGSRAKVEAGIKQLLDLLDMPGRGESEPHVRALALRAWLETSRGWLLMFDNVAEEDYKSVLDVLPQGVPLGDVILTSQRPGAMERLTGNLNTRCLRLEGLQSDEAVDLFYRVSDIERTDENRHHVREIISRNGLLPQAINQAAAYVKKTGISLADYIRRFEDNAQKLLDYSDEWDPERQAISTHMQISLDSLGKHHPDTLSLLKLFALLEPESIPKFRGWRRTSETPELLAGKRPEANRLPILARLNPSSSKGKLAGRATQSMVQVHSGFEASSKSAHLVLQSEDLLDRAVSNLWDFSLIKPLPEGHNFWMHDLTSLVIRQSILKEKKRWISLALEVFFHTFPERDGTAEERNIVDAFLSQAESLISQAEDAGIPVQDYATLISMCGLCFYTRSLYTKALQMYEKARPVYEKYLGSKHERTVLLLHRIGWCHRQRGELALSESIHERTLAIRKKTLPPNSLDLFISMCDLASVIERQGRLKEAEPLFIECYESQKQALGPSDRRTLTAAHNLALCYANQGRVAIAEKLCRDTLRFSEEHYGDEDPGTLRTASNLAVFVDHQGRLDEAMTLYTVSLAGYKNRYGYHHERTIRIRMNLAIVERLRGQYQTAEFALREALSDLKQLLGHEHFSVCVANYDLAEVLHEQGKIKEAKERYQLAITVSESSAPGHPLLFRMLDGRGILYRETGYLLEADEDSKKAYDGNMSLLKWDDPYTPVTAHSRAEVFQQDGRVDEAQDMLEKCLSGFLNLLGPSHPRVFMTRNSLGCLALRKRQFSQAMLHFEAAKSGFSSLLGEKHACVTIIQLNIGRVLLEQQKLDLAADSIQPAKEAFISVLGSEHPHVAVAEFYLGLIASRRGSHQEAESTYRRSIELYEKSLGSDHPNYIRAVIELIKLPVLTQWGLNIQDDSVSWLSPVNASTPSLHAEGCMKSTSKLLTLHDFRSSPDTVDKWTASDGLLWGESTRLRWGRKTTWREVDEGKVTG